MPTYRMLTGEKCYLSPCRPEDAERWAEWFNDLEVTIPLGDEAYTPTSLKAEQDAIQDVLRNNRHVFSIVDLETDEVIGRCLFFNVDANWDARFDLGPPQGHEIVAESNGMKVYMDIASAQRARGTTIDWVSNVRGEGLTIDLPAAPAPVKQMTVQELAERMKAGNITLVDVRGDAERARAFIDGSLVLDRDVMAKLEAMPKDSGLAFICHHGNASQGAAEYFRKKGFNDVSNVAGGINAWSLEVDSSVPTY